MIDDIFEMIMKEARTRRPQALELSILMVLFEVIAKVTDGIKPLLADNIKSTHSTFRRTK